jgi:hypothetical protein
MHLRLVFGLLGIGLLTVLMSPVGYGQFPGGGKGNFPGGGFPGGGFPGGGFGNFGGGKGNRMSMDPSQRFDGMAQGRPYFLISEASPGTQNMLRQYAQEKGVNFPSDQVTREQYLTFSDYLKEKFASGGFFGKKGGPQGGGPGGPNAGAMPPPGPGGGSPTLESLQQLADIDFKSRDENGDGKLNMDEMPGPLKNDLARWDTNKDGTIDQNEYRAYFVQRMQDRMNRFNNNNGSPGNQAGNAIEAALDDDLDKRPVVYRAGKLPEKGLPPWFLQLDTDADGQVALYEWRAGGRDLDEFKDWDRDNDGFITPEEALKVQAALTKSENPLLASSTTPANAAGPGNRNFGPGGRGPGGPGNFGPGNFGPGGQRGPGGPGNFGPGGKGKGGGMMPQFGGNNTGDSGMPQWNGKKGKKGGGG